jgi:hypothetical protein
VPSISHVVPSAMLMVIRDLMGERILALRLATSAPAASLMAIFFGMLRNWPFTV